jgi:DNA-binding IclR family transcriptional regulator
VTEIRLGSAPLERIPTGPHRPVAATIPTNSLERALAILQLLAKRRGGLTNSDIRRRLGVPISTSCYILSRLEQHRFVVRDPYTKRYQIGLNMLTLAHDALRQNSLLRAADPILLGLTSETRLRANIAVMECDQVLLVSKLSTPEAEMEDIGSNGDGDIGMKYPAHATATGKILLAQLPPLGISRFLQQNELKRFTSKTITEKKELMAELASTRARGYALCDEGFTVGIRGLAVLIDSPRLTRRRPTRCTALSVAGRKEQQLWSDVPALLKLVRRSAQQIGNVWRTLAEGSSFSPGISADDFMGQLAGYTT